MKKVMITFVLLLSISLAVAAQAGIGAQIKANNYISAHGDEIQIQTNAQEQTQLRVRDTEVHTGLNITPEQTQNRTRLKVQLSNGQNAEVKVMPNTASETALQRLRLKVCSEENNCTIELKEVQQQGQVKAAYQVQAEKQYKVFGLFRARAQVQTQVDAETGEVIATKTPWWSFMASEQDETQE